MDWEELAQLRADVHAQKVDLFRAEVIMAAAAVDLSDGSKRALKAFAATAPGYTSQTLRRLAALWPVLADIPETIGPDVDLGVVWLALKLSTLHTDDGDDVNLEKFRDLCSEASQGEYSVRDAKLAWGVVTEDTPGAVDLGPAERLFLDVNGTPRAVLVLEDDVETPPTFRRVKGWE